MSNKENLLLRIKAVQVLDQLYYRKGEHLYSHHRVWRNHARRIFGINYTTYASYLRRDVSQLSDRPEVAETVRRLDEILNVEFDGAKRIRRMRRDAICRFAPYVFRSCVP